VPDEPETEVPDEPETAVPDEPEPTTPDVAPDGDTLPVVAPVVVTPVVDTTPLIAPVVPLFPVVGTLPVADAPLFEATPDAPPDADPVAPVDEVVPLELPPDPVEHADRAMIPAIPADAFIHFMVIFALQLKNAERALGINVCTQPFGQANPYRAPFYALTDRS
jgi:hypothetical protein